MKKSRFAWIGIIVVAFLVAALAPIQNIEKQPISTGSKNVSADKIQKAIIRAGARRGWRIKPLGPGHLRGDLAVRSHTAVVDIKFNTKNYSIRYKDSTNLKSDGTNIHRNYNNWVQNLSRDIDLELGLL